MKKRQKVSKLVLLLSSLLVVATVIAVINIKQLNKCNSEMAFATATIENLSKELAREKEIVEKLNVSLINCEWDMQKLEKKNKELKLVLSKSQKFHIPTIKEIKEFLREDDTDKHEWSEEYDCTEFSNELVRKLKERGIFSCLTEINYDEFAHNIVAVNTTEGLIYIEPQDDTIIRESELKIGKDYCDIVGWYCEEKHIIRKISSCYGLLLPKNL